MQNQKELQLYQLGDPLGNIQEFGSDAQKVGENIKDSALQTGQAIKSSAIQAEAQVENAITYTAEQAIKAEEAVVKVSQDAAQKVYDESLYVYKIVKDEAEYIG